MPVLGILLVAATLLVSSLTAAPSSTSRSTAAPKAATAGRSTAPRASGLGVCAPTVAGPRSDAPQIAQAGHPGTESSPEQTKPKPENGKPASKKPEIPFYAPYLKDPASLGFSPDATLLRQIYEQVKRQHIDNDPDQKLFEGVLQEVGVLLKEAGLPPLDPSGLPLNPSLPDRIAGMLQGKVDSSLLHYAMIRGLLKGTDDPYTVLMTPKDYRQLMEQMQNEKFGGIGIYIELNRDNHDQLTVVEPVEGTPAYEAGLLPGDEIVRIDGKSTTGIALDMATSLIRGPEGTPVVLTIRRKEVEGTRDYRILRAQIQVASVTQKMLPGQIGFIKLRLFGAKTGAEFTTALHQLESQGARGLIIDLRNNGGGYITAAVDVCSHFVKPDGLVTYVTDRSHSRKDYVGLGHATVELPTVLLVNGFSASASEITAGCLKDIHAATLVGTKTFGKGSVQQLYPLPSGAAIKITVAHFFTPEGNKINKVGVQPDIKVEMEPRLVGRGDKDLQLQKALEYLQSRGTLKNP